VCYHSPLIIHLSIAFLFLLLEERDVLRKNNVQIQEASHPVPDERSVEGATHILNMVREEASERTLVLCCISGGGSALFCAPTLPLTLHDLITTSEALLASGMTIQQMNIIRKRLEMGKGGRLAAAAYPSTVVTLVLSDILGDPLDLIASGPTVPDTSTWKDARDLVQSSISLQSTLPPAVLQVLQEGSQEDIPLKVFQKAETVLVGNNELAVMAAAEEAQRLGYHPVVLTTRMEGEARHVAGVYTAMAHHLSCQHERDLPYKMANLPAAIIGGGETTVTLVGKTGTGGRNQELALAAALQLKRYTLRNVVLASVGTDGTDGPTDAAGAVVDGGTIDRLDGEAEQALQQHDAYTYFQQAVEGNESPLIVTGPTGTNVADVCVTLIR
jgi:glycerate 2-kinase